MTISIWCRLVCAGLACCVLALWHPTIVEAGAVQDRQDIIENEIAKAKAEGRAAQRADQTAKAARYDADKAKAEAEQAKAHSEKMKTPEGRAEAEKAAEDARAEAEVADKKAQEARQEKEQAKEQTQEAGAKKVEAAENEVKEAEEEAKKAGRSGDLGKISESVKELEAARDKLKKAQKEAAQAGKKAEEESARQIEEADRAKTEADQKVKAAEEAKDPDKVKAKAEEAEAKAREAEKKAKEAEAEAVRAKKNAESAKKAAEDAVKRYKQKYGKREDKPLDDAMQGIAYHQIPKERVANCTFVSMTGETTLNPAFFGQSVSCQFFAEDGRELDGKDVARVEEAPDGSFRLKILDPDVVKVAVLGLLGKAILSAGGPGQAQSPDAGGLVARNGDLRIGPDGTIIDTLVTAAPMAITNPAGQTLSIDKQALDIVAVRENEMAIYGQGFSPSLTIKQTGTVDMTWERTDGSVVTSTVPCWAGNLFMAPITRVGVPADITLDLAGVPSNQEVIVQFMPWPGQNITPQEVTGLAGELTGPIAQITVDRPGGHTLNAVIARGELVERAYQQPEKLDTDALKASVGDMQLEEGARLLGRLQGRPMPEMSPRAKEMFVLHQDALKARTR